LAVDIPRHTPGGHGLNATASYNSINLFPWRKEDRVDSARVERDLLRVLVWVFGRTAASYHVPGRSVLDINNPSSGRSLGDDIDWRRIGATAVLPATHQYVLWSPPHTLNTGGNWMGGEAIIRLQPSNLDR